MRAVLALFLQIVVFDCLATQVHTRYFHGEIEFEINGGTVKYARAWRCEKKIVFRPANNDLFEQAFRQVPTPAESFVVKKFGEDHVVVFENWLGCGTERRWGGEGSRVSLIDSVAAPKYGENLSLRVGEPATVLNPFERKFRARLVRESVREIDRNQYEGRSADSDDPGLDLLYQLRLKAAYGLAIYVLTWNDTDKSGLRTSLTLNKSVWEVERLTVPPPKGPSNSGQESPILNVSFIPLPLGYLRVDGQRGPPSGISVKYAGGVIELDARGFAEIHRPEPGIRLARFYAQVNDNVWALRCSANPDSQCPKLPVGVR